MREIVNLLVDLDERFDEIARSRALQTIAASGLACEDARGADDTTLAWIDETFGGAWSSEANVGWNIVASRASGPLGFATYDANDRRYRWLRGVARDKGVGIFGPFGVAANERGRSLGRALLCGALAGLRAHGYRRALIPAVSGERLIRYYIEHAQARVVERFTLPELRKKKHRAVVMASGNGSNFQAVAEQVRNADLPLDLASLVCNTPSAYVLERARTLKMRTHIIEWQRTSETRAEYDRRLLDLVRADKPELILLLGWMHLLDASFIRAFDDIINVHPAFLPLDPSCDDVGLPDGTRTPAFRGAHAVVDALKVGSRWIGVSVHYVTAQTDRGAILMRAPLRIEDGESPDALFARLQALEHDLVPRAVQRWANER